MKKYIKPELIFERFELSQQIAACDFDSQGTANDGSCSFTGQNTVTGEQVNIFLSTDSCKVIAEGYCYHSSTGYSVFNS